MCMAVTISHQSALDVLRTIRANGENVHDMDVTTLARPATWSSGQWGKRNFEPEVWRWKKPTKANPLHVLASVDDGRIRSNVIRCHTVRRELPPDSVLWLDEHSSMVCPELLFLQMAEVLPVPMLVLLGYELCGNFSRQADNPLSGYVVDQIPAATDVSHIASYLSKLKWVPGLSKAKHALRFVSDHAVSAPEAVLATMLSLPMSESGYGMGPVTLNSRVNVDASPDRWVSAETRFPDLMLPFASVGLNYDGEGHLDLSGLVSVAQATATVSTDSSDEQLDALQEKLSEVRTKVVDDNMRFRQLAAKGLVVFPVTKEDLFGEGHLDYLVSQMLSCAHTLFGVDISKYKAVLEDTEAKRDRQELLDSMLPQKKLGRTAYGAM